MLLLKLFWFLLLGLLARRLFLGWQKVTRAASAREKLQKENRQKQNTPSPLTDQDISDADFEEIP